MIVKKQTDKWGQRMPWWRMFRQTKENTPLYLKVIWKYLFSLLTGRGIIARSVISSNLSKWAGDLNQLSSTFYTIINSVICDTHTLRDSAHKPSHICTHIPHTEISLSYLHVAIPWQLTLSLSCPPAPGLSEGWVVRGFCHPARGRGSAPQDKQGTYKGLASPPSASPQKPAKWSIASKKGLFVHVEIN